MRKWWTKKRNAERASKAVHDNTMDKREERILCFLGFVNRYQCLSEDLPLTVSLYLNHRLVQTYLDYLTKVRGSSDGTIAEALTGAVSACRWLYRKEKSINARHPPVIRRYMDYRNTHQASALQTRAENDVDELQDQNRWVEWSEFTALIAKLRREWDEINDDEDDEPTEEQALMLHDLLLLGLYSCIPSRGAEVRLLQFIPEDMVKTQMMGPKQTFKQYADKEQMNLLTRVDGVWKMYISQYKVSHARGVDVTELSSFPWWTDLFQLYHKTYRPLLLRGNHDFVFLTRSGEPFTGPYFSEFISNLMSRHTGKRVATNLLRSSFVTHFYSSDAAQDPTARESVAAVMRHTVNQALKTYYRRSSSAKKRKGLALLAETAATPFNAPTAEEVPQGPQVVSFQRVPHQVIRVEGDKVLLAKMTRSPVSNAPVYFVELNVTYEWHARSTCAPLAGQWEEDGFLLL